MPLRRDPDFERTLQVAGLTWDDLTDDLAARVKDGEPEDEAAAAVISDAHTLARNELQKRHELEADR